MKNFNNKVAAITGAGSGIGQQLAVLLAKQGCHLALSDINEQGLMQTVDLLKESNVRVTIQKVNVAELEQVRQWAAQVEQDHGSVNMIFNNAGVALGSTRSEERRVGKECRSGVAPEHEKRREVSA